MDLSIFPPNLLLVLEIGMADHHEITVLKGVKRAERSFVDSSEAN